MASIQKRIIKGKPGKDGFRRQGTVFDVYYRYYDPITNTKKKTSKKGFLTEKKARVFANKVEHEVASGQYIHESKMKVSELINDWLESVRPTVAYNSFRGYNVNARKHIIPVLGNHIISKLNITHIQRFYNSLGENGKGLSATTIRFIHMNLSSALNYAVSRKLVPTNISKQAKLPKVTKTEKCIYKPAEILNLIESASDLETQCVIALAGMMGLRRAEIFALSYDKDLDLHDKSITIRKQLIKTKGGYMFTEPKTEKSKRKLYMPTIVYNLVKKQYQKQLNLIASKGTDFNPERLLICSNTGRNFSFEGMASRFHKAVKSSGQKRICLHELRHSFASMAILNDINIKTVSEMLGHSNISTTADTYMHVLDQKKKEAVKSLDDVITQCRSRKVT